MTVGAIGELGGSKLHVDPAASDEDARRWIADFGGDEIQTLEGNAACASRACPMGDRARSARSAMDMRTRYLNYVGTKCSSMRTVETSPACAPDYALESI